MSGQTWQILLPVVLRSAAELPQVSVVPSAAGPLDAAELPRVSAVSSVAGPLDAAELPLISAVQATELLQVSVVLQAAALPAVVSWFFAAVPLFASGLSAVELPPVMPLDAAGLLSAVVLLYAAGLLSAVVLLCAAGLLPAVMLLYSAGLLPEPPPLSAELLPELPFSAGLLPAEQF